MRAALVLAAAIVLAGVSCAPAQETRTSPVPPAGGVFLRNTQTMFGGVGRYLLNDDWQIGPEKDGRTVFTCAGARCGGPQVKVVWAYSLRRRQIDDNAFRSRFGELNGLHPGRRVGVGLVSGWRRGRDTLVFRGETSLTDAQGRTSYVHTAWVWWKGALFEISSEGPDEAYVRSNLDIFIEKAATDHVNRWNARRGAFGRKS